MQELTEKEIDDWPKVWIDDLIAEIYAYLKKWQDFSFWLEEHDAS